MTVPYWEKRDAAEKWLEKRGAGREKGPTRAKQRRLAAERRKKRIDRARQPTSLRLNIEGPPR